MRVTPTLPVAAGVAADDRAALAQEVCRGAAEDGFLDEVGLAFGECVNLVSGRAADLVAGRRSADPRRAPTGTSTEGRGPKAMNGTHSLG